MNHSSGIIHSNLVNAIGNKALSKKTVESWCNKFKGGCTGTLSAHRGDREDSLKKQQKVKKMIFVNQLVINK